MKENFLLFSVKTPLALLPVTVKETISLSGLGSGLAGIESKFKSVFKPLTEPLLNLMLPRGMTTYLTLVASVKFSAWFASTFVSFVEHSPPPSVEWDLFELPPAAATPIYFGSKLVSGSGCGPKLSLSWMS